jgi:hypothetical protein
MADPAMTAIETSCFRELGASDDLVRYVAAQRYPATMNKRFWRAYWVFLVLLVGGLAVLGFAYSGLLGWLRDLRLSGREVWYYHQDAGPSVVLAVFAWIFVVGVVQGELHFRRDPTHRQHDMFRNIEIVAMHGGIVGIVSRRVYRLLFRGLAGLPLEEQLEKLERRSRAIARRPAILLAALTVALGFLDLRAYDVVDSRGLTTTRYWTAQRLFLGWERLEAIEVGCWIFDRGGLSLKYTAVFDDGRRVNLFDPLPHHDELVVAERVEFIRRQRKVPKRMARFTHGSRRAEEWAHPDCAATLEERYSLASMDKLYTLLVPD